MKEPEALLSEGGARRERGGSGVGEREGRSVVLSECGGQPRDGGRGEEGSERKLDAEGEADAGDETGGGEGVATEGEEVSVARDDGEGEDVGEELGEEGLCLATRSGVGRGLGGDSGGDVEGGEGRPVDLAAGGEGERGEGEEARGDEGFGKRGSQRVAKRRERGRGVVEDEEGDEEGVARGAEGEDRGLTDTVEAKESGFDFLDFDADAAELELEVGAAEEGEGAVVIPAGPVASVVEAGARGGREGVWDEALSGEVRKGVVAASEADAADEELAWDAWGERLEGVVEDVEAAARKRAAETNGTVGEGDFGGDVDAGFSGPVGVDETGGSQREGLDERVWEDFSAGDEDGEGAEGVEGTGLLEG
nr:hypothetical protein [Myxococcus sp. CA040A]